jgi:hypothetical protein
MKNKPDERGKRSNRNHCHLVFEHNNGLIHIDNSEEVSGPVRDLLSTRIFYDYERERIPFLNWLNKPDNVIQVIAL